MQNFLTLDYLQNGSVDQKSVYHCLRYNKIFDILASYSPLLVGTIPLNIHTKESDLDILCSAKDLDLFSDFLELNFQSFEAFKLYPLLLQNDKSIACSFKCDDWRIEIVAQSKPSDKQLAFLHMLAEAKLLEKGGESARKAIIALKENGMKTEPAFAKYFGIEGNPYQALLSV